jgi:archaellum biogenesis ATPase FlaH
MNQDNRKISNGVITIDDQIEIHKAKNELRLPSQLGCFSGSNGLRPGQLSILLGPKGNGKSAMAKTISFECAREKVKCLHVLSEEQSSIYKASVSGAFAKGKEHYLENLLFDSMLDWPKSHMSAKGFFTNLYETINEMQPEVVIFDNFSTSFIGDLPIGIQGEVIKGLRNMAVKFDIILLVIMHTVKGTDVYKQLISGEDVRGNSSSTNTSAYTYALSTFFRCDPPRAILYVDKARYHSDLNQTYWELLYDKDVGVYVGDKKISHEEVKSIMAEGREGVSIGKMLESKIDILLRKRLPNG